MAVVEKYEPFKKIDEKFVRLPTDLTKLKLLSSSEQTWDGVTKLAGVPIDQRHSLAYRARNILAHNHSNDVTRISIIGKTGSGKTTLVWYLFHLLHELAEKEFGISYGIVWAGKKELSDMRAWIKTLPYGANLMICFDDVSFQTEKMGRKAKLDLKQLMTEIRHELGDVKLIVVYNYHYTKGMDKQLRDTEVVFLTSYSHEEDANIKQLLGWWNGPKFGTFQYALRMALTRGYWLVPCPPPKQNRNFLYQWKKPLALCLVDDFGDLGFGMFVDPEKHPAGKFGCNMCVPPGKKIGNYLPAHDFLMGGIEHFGPEFVSVLRWVMYFRGARDCVLGTYAPELKFITNRLKSERVPLDDLADELRRTKKYGNVFKQLPKEKEQAIFNKIAKKSASDNKSSPSDVFGEADAFQNLVEKQYGEKAFAEKPDDTTTTPGPEEIDTNEETATTQPTDSI